VQNENADLKSILDRFYSDFDFKGTISRDPIEFPHSYPNPRDKEISGFIAAAFAYGNVNIFKAVLRNMLSKMGESPYEFILKFDINKAGKIFNGIKYRFNENQDILALFLILNVILRKYGSLEKIFRINYHHDDQDIGNALTGLISSMLEVDTSLVYGNNIKPPGLLQFIPSPQKGSACKRMNLYLRWMIRDRDIDFGIWKGIPKGKLVIPLDTHIARISRCLNLTTRNSQDWKMAVQITESLRTLDPDDPLKYDFALCHQGISRVCSTKNCKGCRLFGKTLL